MNGFDFSFTGAAFTALGSGALWWPQKGLLCVSDLHLGKSERMTRRGIGLVPPYDTRDTLMRLEADLARTDARQVACLGDSFDDLAAADGLFGDEVSWITRMQAGRRWIWIEGNHDPGPLDLGGTHLAELTLGPLTFRHIAKADATGEISGHYHPKARIKMRGRDLSRPSFLLDHDRLILPAYGTYTGGLRSQSDVLTTLMHHDALAILTGLVPTCIPMPR